MRPPSSSVVEAACNAGDSGDRGSTPGLGRSPGGGNVYPLLVEKFHGQRSPVGYSPCGFKETGLSNWAPIHAFHLSHLPFFLPSAHPQKKNEIENMSNIMALCVCVTWWDYTVHRIFLFCWYPWVVIPLANSPTLVYFRLIFFWQIQWLTLEIIQTFMREFIQEVWEIFSSPNLVLESHLLVDVWIYRFVIAVRRGVCWVWHARVHWDVFIYLRCFLHPIFQFSKLNSLLCLGIYRINMWGSSWELGKNTWHRCTQPYVEPCIHRILLRIHCIKWVTFFQLSSMLS